MNNIMVSFWEYFGYSEEKSDDTPSNKKSAAVAPLPHKHTLADVVFDEDDKRIFKTPTETPKNEIEENLLQDLDDDAIFESEMILLKSVDEMTKDISRSETPTILNTESNELFQIRNSSYDIKELWDNSLVPILIKGANAPLNFFDSILYFKKNQTLRFPKSTYVKLRNYYGVANHHIHGTIVLALILGVNINLYCSGKKIEIIVKDPEITINYLYYQKRFYPLINVETFSSNYIKVDKQIF